MKLNNGKSIIFFSTNFINRNIYNKFGDNMIDELLHEIRNPLTVCNGYVDICMKNSEGNNGKYLSIIKEEIKRTINIINNYKNNNLELKEFDIVTLIKDVKSILDTLYRENNTIIKIQQNDKIYINGDYNKLKQVFINILKNSLESKDKEKLIIKINFEDKKNECKITIEDNGCGIAKESLKKIFLKNYTTKDNGMGVGTSFIKEIIDKHNGKIEYKSTEKVGTIVIIRLPNKKVIKTF